MQVTLLIPTLNEIECMKEIMPRIKREWVDQILIVDGGSTDGTIEYARKYGYFVLEPKVRGLTNQLFESFKMVKGDIVVLFSPDGNSIPELIPDLVNKMKEGYDMVIVSRYTQGAKSHDDDIFTRMGNALFTRLVNLIFGASYTDVLVIFRGFRKDILNKISHDPKGDIDMELSIQCAKKGLRVAEIPGDEPKRIAGNRKMKVIKTGTIILMQLIKEAFRW